MPTLLNLGLDVTAVPHCCSEAGTMSISRPDISNAMFKRKQETLKNTLGSGEARKILTNCPSCIQGLGRQKNLTPVHLAEELACLTGGKNWVKEFKEVIANLEVVTF